MTSPDREVPEGAVQISSLSELQAYTEDGVRQRLEAPLRDTLDNVREALRDGLLGSIGDIFRGNTPRLPGLGFLRDAWSDGQEALTDRLDLLDGVRGYAAAYMSQNRNAEWGISNNRDLPYDAQLGPARGATVAGGGITFDESGLWSVSLLASARSTAYTSSWSDTDSVRVWLRAYHPDGSLYSEVPLEALAGKSAVSMTTTIPLVVDQPGTYLRVSAWSSRWRWWNGGTRFSRLAVVKHDNRILNPGVETVPDETQP